MLDRADDLAKLTVQDDKGQPLELGSLWRDHAVALVFVRHFGWLHCREHAVQLHRANIPNLVIVGNGAPHFIEGFRETTGYTGPIYTDPTLAVYKAAELKRGAMTILKLRAAAATIGALKRGFRQSGTYGDATQQGGVLVVAPDGRILYHHISEYPGDNASPEEIRSHLAA